MAWSIQGFITANIGAVIMVLFYGFILVVLGWAGWYLYKKYFVFTTPVTILTNFGEGEQGYDTDRIKVYEDQKGKLRAEFFSRRRRKGVISDLSLQSMFSYKKSGAMILVEEERNQFFPCGFGSRKVTTIKTSIKDAFLREHERISKQYEGSWLKQHASTIIILGAIAFALAVIVITLQTYSEVASTQLQAAKQASSGLQEIAKSFMGGGAP